QAYLCKSQRRIRECEPCLGARGGADRLSACRQRGGCTVTAGGMPAALVSTRPLLSSAAWLRRTPTANSLSRSSVPALTGLERFRSGVKATSRRIPLHRRENPRCESGLL